MDVNLFELKKYNASELAESIVVLNSNFETLVIGVGGEMIINQDQVPFLAKSPYLCLISKNDMVTLSSFKEDTIFFTLSFNKMIVPNFYFELAKLYKENNIVDFDLKPCFSNIISLCEMIEFELQSEQVNSSIIINLIVSIFSIYQSEQSKMLKENVYGNHNNLHLNNFLNILEANFKEDKVIAFYANQLVISPRQLSKITTDLLGVNVTHLISNRKIIEAKKLLAQSDLNVSEIGYSIGYKEKSHFSKIFKKIVGLTPVAYRKVVKAVN